MQNSLAKKIFAVGVAASTALMALAPFAARAAAHGEGTNIKSSDGTVWMIIGGQRRPYTSAGAFLSYGFNSFSQVVDANSDDLSLAAGAFIPPQDGKIICSDRGADKGTCYLVTQGMKAGFTSASVFTGLGFSFSRTQSGDVSWMPSTANIDNTTDAHRVGVLINNGGTVQLRGVAGNMGIPDLATFNSWGYSFADVVPANASDKAIVQSGIMCTRQAGQLSPVASCATAPTPTGATPTPGVISGSVSASLAYDTPAAQTVAVAAATNKTVVTLAKYTFSGSGTVTQLQVKRLGVSSDSVLSNVYLFNGDTRLTDGASVGGNSLVTFASPSGLFTVNGTMTISVVAEIAAGTSSGSTVGSQLTSFTVANGSPASVAISGNLFTVSQSSDLAYATFGTVTPSGSSFDPAKDTEVFRSNVSVNTRDMTLSRFIIRNIGSAQQADMNNFRLLVDGTQVGQVQSLDSNGYAYFSFSPITLKSGTRVFRVLADVIGGSSRNFQFQIRNVSDVNFVDTQYNTTISPSNTFPVGSASSNSIASGTLVIQKASDSPSGNVTDNSSDVTLAKYTVTAYGEPMKIETLKVGATSSNASVGSLRNGRILINGVQYGSTATLSKTTNNTYTTGGTQYTLNYTVMPGTPITLEIHADMFDNDGTNSLVNLDTVTAYLMADGTSNVQRLVSLGYVAYPSVSVAGSSLTDVTGSVTLTKNTNYANQTTPLPRTNYKIGSYNLAGSTSEDVTLNSLDLGTTASSSLFNYTHLNNVKAMIGGNMFGTVKSTLSSGTSTFSGSYTLPKGQTVAIEFWADLATPTSGAASGEYVISNTCVNGTAVNSSSSIIKCQSGQTVTYGSGVFTIAQDPSTPVAAIVAGNQTRTVAAFKYTTANDSYTVNEITLSLVGATTVSSVTLKDGSTTVGTPQPGGSTSVTFSNLNWVVPNNTTKVLNVELALGDVGVGMGTSGENVQVTVATVKSAPSSSGVQSTSSPGVAGNVTYVYKSIPTVTNVSLPTTQLSAGTQTLYKFSVSSGGSGTIGWAKFGFTIATTTGVTVTGLQVWDADTNTQISGTASSTYTSTGMVTEFWPNVEQQVSGAKTYVLKGTVSLSGTGYRSISTNITQPTGHAVPVAATTATSTNATLVWSDLSAQSHSFTTSDWNNDNLVKNLPTDSQTLSVTN